MCLNGPRGAADGTAVPLTPGSMAQAAAEAVAAGATDIHVHPKTPCGRDSLSPRVVAATLEAIRARVSVPVGVTTGAWAEPDPAARLARVRSWTVLPDHASVNWHEDGAEGVATALLETGIGIEAGVFSGGDHGDGLDTVARLGAWPHVHRVLRVLAEITDTDPVTAPATAARLLERLAAPDGPGTAARHGVLLHGEDGAAWTVLRMAVARGLDTRIGLEDVLLLPDGTPAPDNAALVLAAREVWNSRPR